MRIKESNSEFLRNYTQKGDPHRVPFLCKRKTELFFFAPLDVARVHVHHTVGDEFNESAVGKAVLGIQVIVLEEFANLSLTVGAGGAYIFLGFGTKAILEGLTDLPHLFAASNIATPLINIVTCHDGEAGATAAAVVVNTMAGHFAELRRDFM